MKDLEQLKSDVRTIRAGGIVEGIILSNDIITTDGISYKVIGSERLRLVEISQEDIILQADAQTSANATEIPPSAKETISEPKVVIQEDVEEICSKCGQIFLRDKYHPNIIKCPSCRVRIRTSGAVERTSTCKGCGIEYIISKFHPYLETTQCPACTKKTAKKRHAVARKARKEALNQI